MNALRLVIVYFGTGALAIWLVHRFVRKISILCALALLLIPLLITGRAIFTGNYYGPLNIAYGPPPLGPMAGNIPRASLTYPDGIFSDVQIQNVPWRKAVREEVKRGHLPLLDRFLFAGDPLLGTMQPAVFSPGTWIEFLLPLATAWTFGCALNLLLAALFTFVFLREIELEEVPALLGAAAWSLGGFFVFCVGWPITASFAPMPLLILGATRLARGKPGGFGATVVALTLSVFGGHPESTLFVTAAAGIVFLWELIRSRYRTRALGLILGAGALAFGLCAVQLLPFFATSRQTWELKERRQYYAHDKKSIPVREALKSGLGAVYPLLYTQNGLIGAPKNIDNGRAVYCGGAVIALALLGLFSRRRERWLFSGLGAGAFFIALGFPVITDLILKLPLFNIAIPNYLSGVATFCLGVMAALGLQEILDRPRRTLATISAAAGMSAAAAGIWLLRRPGIVGVSHGRFELFLALLITPMWILAILLWPKTPICAHRLGAAVVGVFLLFRLGEMRPNYPSFSAKFFYPPVPEFSRLPRGGPPYRIVATGFNLVPNQATMYELEDLRGYQALHNVRLYRTAPLWGNPLPVWFMQVNDLTVPFLSLANVRFAIGGPAEKPPAGWNDFTRGPDCAIFENSHVLPRAFAPATVRFVRTGSDVVSRMKSCTDFSRTAWIETDDEPPGEISNGQAAVIARENGSNLDLTIRAGEAAWVVITNTAWEGWRAKTAQEDLPLKFADEAFLALRAPAGTTHVRLVYWPAAFETGGIVSLVALLITAALIGKNRRISRAGSGGPSTERVLP